MHTALELRYLIECEHRCWANYQNQTIVANPIALDGCEQMRTQRYASINGMFSELNNLGRQLAEGKR